MWQCRIIEDDRENARYLANGLSELGHVALMCRDIRVHGGLAGLSAGPGASGICAGSDDGRKLPPRLAAVARQYVYILWASIERLFHDGDIAAAGDGCLQAAAEPSSA